MKLLKGGAHLSTSGVTTLHDEEKFLIQCPNTCIIYVIQKKRSSSNECYYITPQRITIRRDERRHAIFQYYGDGLRRIHFRDSQIDWAIRSGNFMIKEI